jgi:hypothetical protein
MEKMTRSNEKIRVFFTDTAVRSSEALAAVPPGCRMARPGEVALEWKRNPSFMKKLYDLTCAVWANQVGLPSSGPHRIDDEGNFVKISEEEYYKLADKDVSWHYQGDGLVTLGSGAYTLRWLPVDADKGPNYTAMVAYVPLSLIEKAALLIRRIVE